MASTPPTASNGALKKWFPLFGVGLFLSTATYLLARDQTIEVDTKRSALNAAAFRNGKEAVVDAKAACNLCSWGDWDYIDTLAAAYAEAGDFESAIKFEQKAIAKAKKDDNTKGAQERLALYQQHKPFRDGN